MRKDKRKKRNSTFFSEYFSQTTPVRHIKEKNHQTGTSFYKLEGAEGKRREGNVSLQSLAPSRKEQLQYIRKLKRRLERS
jgi:hypothetical protein